MSWSTPSDTSQTFILILGCVVLSLLLFIIPMFICVRCCGSNSNRSRNGRKKRNGKERGVLPLHMKDLAPLSTSSRSTSTSSSESGGSGVRDTTSIKEVAPTASLDKIVFTSPPRRTLNDVTSEDVTYPKPCYDGAKPGRMALGWKPEVSQNQNRRGILPLFAGGPDEQVILDASVATSASSASPVARTGPSVSATRSRVRAKPRKGVLPSRVGALMVILEDEAGEAGVVEEVEVVDRLGLPACTGEDYAAKQRKVKKDGTNLETVEEAEVEEEGIGKIKHEVYTSPRANWKKDCSKVIIREENSK